MAETTNFVQLVANAASTAVAQVARDPNIPELPAHAAQTVANAVQDLVKSDPTLQVVAGQVDAASASIPWYKSPVAVGVVVASVAQILQQTAGVTVPAEWQSVLVNSGAAGTAIGLLLAAWGRLTSKLQPVTLTAQGSTATAK